MFSSIASRLASMLATDPTLDGSTEDAMRTLPTSCALVATLALAACGSSSTAPLVTPVTIDGVSSPGEWDDATQVPAFAGATFFYKNDGETLYLALSVQDASLGADDELTIRFDNDRNGVMDTGEDNIGVGGDGTFRDAHAEGGSWGFVDQEVDGSGAAGSSGGIDFFELAHPLDSGDTDDFSVSPGDRLGYCLYFFLDGTASDLTTFPSGCQLVGTDLGGYQEIVIR